MGQSSSVLPGDGAVNRAHAKIVFHKAPGHRAVGERAAAYAGSVVVVVAIAGAHDMLRAVAGYDYAAITLVIGTEGAAEIGGALVAQIVFAAIEGGVPFAAFEEHYGEPGGR